MPRKSLFPETGSFYKGNTHLHTTRSDGRLLPEEVAKAYREAGYSFIVLTDHWYYGNDPELSTEDFLVFAGVEIDCLLNLGPGKGLCHHVTAMADPAVSPFRTGDRLEALRSSGDMARMAEELNRTGHLCIYAHPEWSHVKAEEYDRIAEHCFGMEIYNHASWIDADSGDAETYFRRGFWENRPKPAFASDDTHHSGHLFGGFVGVKAEALNYRAVLDSLRAGHFYASMGPEIRDFYAEDGYVCLECSPCDDIAFHFDAWWSIHAVRDCPGTTRAVVRLPENVRTVYAVCRDGEKKAWTQVLSID